MDRAIVTLAILSYNQANYVADAVKGALAQTYTPLQIIFSDDASTDGTFDLIRKLVSHYTGPHRLTLNRNRSNFGVGGQVNKVMALAEGEIVVVGAADDISDPDRVEAIVRAFDSASEKTFSVWSAARYIDDQGARIHRRFPAPRRDYSDRDMARNITPVIGATHAWRREVFDIFGPLLDGVMFEDNAISFRSHLLGAIAYIDRELVSYRTHAGNITNFTKVADLNLLYSNAARRVGWALVGVEQRKKDLACAVARNVTTRDVGLLQAGLEKQRRLLERQRRGYACFPSLPLDLLFAATHDIEIAKVALRSLIYRLHSRRG